ncbi:BQ5605_C012g06737 [Microbotryum silenes-dioicae]|uniref:Inositol-1-monophosphatase n=1 Tax=Microbotryum silenes-dioicae TaxID=796604 RepID=A0A2X0MD95_9BASI|nr:BQ5605_C012g06737 [Microbotryum silenes-dioicae]
MLSPTDLTSIHDFAIALAQRAGAMIKAASESRFAEHTNIAQDSSKKNRVDLVTETDQAVEAFIKQSISDKYPGHAFIGEESFAGGEVVHLTDTPTWIVDPIDGTTNFIHGFDHVCVSIGFTHEAVPVIGVIFNPFLNKLYSAIKGQGAFLNQRIRLPLSHPKPPPLASLSDALIAVEWGSDRSADIISHKASTFSRLAGDPSSVQGGVMAHSLRSIGSAALNYAYVASGQVDLYWEIGCWSWDVCAGTVIAREAGAKVFGRGGKNFEAQDLMGHHFFVVRAIEDGEKETGPQAQARIAAEFFEAAEEWEA